MQEMIPLILIFVNIFIAGMLVEQIKPPFLYKTLRMIGSFEFIIFGIFYIYYWFVKDINIAKGSGTFIFLCCFILIIIAGMLESFEKKIKKAEQGGLCGTANPPRDLKIQEKNKG